MTNWRVIIRQTHPRIDVAYNPHRINLYNARGPFDHNSPLKTGATPSAELGNNSHLPVEVRVRGTSSVTFDGVGVQLDTLS